MKPAIRILNETPVFSAPSSNSHIISNLPKGTLIQADRSIIRDNLEWIQYTSDGKKKILT